MTAEIIDFKVLNFVNSESKYDSEGNGRLISQADDGNWYDSDGNYYDENSGEYVPW